MKLQKDSNAVWIVNTDIAQMLPNLNLFHSYYNKINLKLVLEATSEDNYSPKTEFHFFLFLAVT